MRWPWCLRTVRLDPEAERKLDQIVIALKHLERKLKAMSEASDALNKKIDNLQTAVSGIRQDIVDIKASLPASGGMTAEEVTALTAKVDAVLADAQELDSENPAPTPPAA